MNIFKTLGKSPGCTDADPALPLRSRRKSDTNAAARIALRFIMAWSAYCSFCSSLRFCLVHSIRISRRWRASPGNPLPTPRLWINTGFLALASLAMQFGLRGARRGKLNHAVIGISAAVFFSCCSCVAQLDLWQHLQAMGFYVNSNPANSYFYVLTALHGLHLMGGLIVLSNVVFRVWYDEAPEALAAPLQLCTTYWHFLLGVWLVLFALLTSRPETINALAAMCGF